MGCDIHLWVERREGAGAPWQLATPPAWQCSWCRGRGTNGSGGNCYWCAGQRVESRFHIRRYYLFALLADVRNEDALTPIAPPRGWPHDLSAGLREWHRSCDEDADFFDTYYEQQEALGVAPGRRVAMPGEHSESWLTLAEVISFFEAAPSYREYAGETFVDHFVPACLRLGTPENVRIVFNFDS